jgi:hypothetical protein
MAMQDRGDSFQPAVRVTGKIHFADIIGDPCLIFI